MLDFVNIIEQNSKNSRVIYPDFASDVISKDLMTKGHAFYAIWDEDNKKWCKRKTDVARLVDKELRNYISEKTDAEMVGVKVRWARNVSSGIMMEFNNYCKNVLDDNFIPLDSKIVFKSEPYKKDNYSTHRLDYDPVEAETPYYDKLMGTLYFDEEREKIEWIIGAVLNRDNGKIQKFLMLYGDKGTGKSTVINIINLLFKGYTKAFNAAALGNANSSFSLEPFRDNPVIAYQHDGNLSRIEDNTKLNSIVSHEMQPINEKNKSIYEMRINSVLILGSNDRVKITNAKSGLLRRLLDAKPSQRLLKVDEYEDCMDHIPFELGGIANRCLNFYKKNKHKYDKYVSMEMMAGTNDFFDFVSSYYDQFCADMERDGYTTLNVAWERYKKYVEDAAVRNRLNRRSFGDELGNYFKEGLHDEYIRMEDGSRVHIRSIYRGFKKDFMFVSNGIGGASCASCAVEGTDAGDSVNSVDSAAEKKDTSKSVGTGSAGGVVGADDTLLPEWLQLKDVSKDPKKMRANPLNVYFANATAQYSKEGPNGTSSPKTYWSDATMHLSSMNTAREHYILTQSVEPTFIVVDFDLKDDSGEKSLKKNLEAAAKFPKTYAETSKSGKGLHLHYIYDGDVSELSMLYDMDIEIKVFKGNSALRRRLTLCNNEEIAHLSSGLPLKEVKHKVIDLNRIENEKHLRACIMKALQKKVHANTRPNVDYIKHVTDIAYESGLHYDVRDLASSISNFAAGSTNQSDYCLSVVPDIHYCSDDISDNMETKEYLEKPIAFFDWEVFPNLTILCYKVEGGIRGEEGKKEVVKLINPTANQVSAFLHDYRAVGFNNLDYDNQISYARILGWTNEEIFKLSKALTSKDKEESRKAKFREAKNLSYTDIYDFSNTKQSLKLWEIELGIHHQEFPLPWDEPVPENKWDEAADYCANDVCATEVLFYHLKEDWDARQVLSKLSGLTVNDRTNAHSERIIFGRDRHPQSKFNYVDLSEEFKGYEFNKFGKFDKERYNKNKDGESVMTSGKSIFMGDDPSEGGYVYYETGIYKNVALLDIASLHPSTIEWLQLFGPEYTARFSEVKSARVAIKHKAWDEARGYLDGALVRFLEGVEKLSEDEQQEFADSLSYAFKIVINSVYGCTSAPFPNAFKDPRNIDNIVAKRGALFMILLKHEVQKRGFTVAHVKTDSIKIPDATEEIISFVMDFGKKYGYNFEHEATYKKFCLLNKSVYIAKYDEFGERTKGGRHANCWTPTGAEFQHPYIFKTLFSHEPITFKDMCETKSVSHGASIYLDMNEKLTWDLEEEVEEMRENLETLSKGKLEARREIKKKVEEIESIHNLEFVGRCGLFCPVVHGAGGGIMLRVSGEKKDAVNGTKGYRWLEADYILKNGLEDQIDISYFRKLVDDAYADIAKYGDADEFVNG